MIIAIVVAALVVSAEPAVKAAPASPVLQEPVTVTRGQLFAISLGRELVYVSPKGLQVRPALSSAVTTDKQSGRLSWVVALSDGADVATVKRDMTNRVWLSAMAAAQTKTSLADIVTKSGSIADAKVEALIASVDLAILVEGKVAARGGLEKAQIAWRD